MLLPSLGSVVHVIVAQHIFHEPSFFVSSSCYKSSDRQLWVNIIVNPNETAPNQGLPCLPFRVHLSSALVFSQSKLFKVQDNYINVFVCQLFTARPRSAKYTIGICLERANKAENSK